MTLWSRDPGARLTRPADRVPQPLSVPSVTVALCFDPSGVV